MDELKKQKERDAQKAYQEAMYQENLDNIARKQKLKQDSFSEDKKINAEREQQWIRDEQRKINEANFRLQRSTEGPAHLIVQKIVDLKRDKDNEMYQTIFHQENNLNKQLKSSEDFAKARLLANGQSLEEEWQKNTAYKLKKKADDEERNNRILETMRKMLTDQEAEDIRNKEKKRQAAMRYQLELDAQLQDLRQRSIDTLQSKSQLLIYFIFWCNLYVGNLIRNHE